MQVSEVIHLIVSWLGDYCTDNGLEGFVIGVSGGIDSAVTSTLCAKTGKDVLLFSMPIYQPAQQASLAKEHIKWLEHHHPHVKGITVDLTPPFQALESTFPTDIQDELTMANTRSRMRMLTLYAFASHHKMFVVGTGNKIEDFGIGFYTKYGDGGVDVSPIADLTKSEVYDIGKQLGVGEAIITAPPTDGLWTDDRSDESQIGATYPELEWAMGFDAHPERENGLNTRQKEVLTIYRRFHKANQHKMGPIPVFQLPVGLR